MQDFFGSSCRCTGELSYLKPYWSATCNMTVTHDQSAVGLVKTF